MQKRQDASFIAHLRRENDIASEHSLKDHLVQTALRAERFCGFAPWGKLAYTAGLLHDIGKYSEEFQERLRRKFDGLSANRVDHSTAGAKLACETCKGDRQARDVAKLLAYVIAGHHAGLPDGTSGIENDTSCLEGRLGKKIPNYSACPKDLIENARICTEYLQPLLRQRRTEYKGKDLAFGLSFFTRMLYSCVVDADSLDTEAFMDPERASLRRGYPALDELDRRLTETLKKKTGEAPESLINGLRSAILRQCVAAAPMPVGLFSLTVPTGGGKTLSSLAFALKHALKHGLDRVIYVIPYTSIIEQNASVFRESVGRDAVVEHHSNVDLFEEQEGDEEAFAYRFLLAFENWDAPLIVTTNVQFFESLFSHRRSQCRKLHNVMNSVVILDEAQLLPADLLRPCIAALRELSTYYNTSVVLCTATQPALSSSETFKDGLDHVTEIMRDPTPEVLHKSFKRVRLQIVTGSVARESGPPSKLSDEHLSVSLSKHRQALCIVNTKAHARKLFEMMKHQEGNFHLSTFMCPAHRSVVLERITETLAANEPCKVISTQLVEAGVDIDFPVVFRAMAGVDSIAQAAGRCNREGRLEIGTVFLFEPDATIPPGHLRQAADTTEEVMRRYEDILSLDAVHEYFETLFWTKGEKLDEKQILQLLAEEASKGNFPFRKVGERFRLIDDDTRPIIVPWAEEGRNLVEEIRETEFPSFQLTRKAQRFSVSVWHQLFQKLRLNGAIDILHEQYAVLANPDVYRDDVGLCLEDPLFYKAETLMA